MSERRAEFRHQHDVFADQPFQHLAQVRDRAIEVQHRRLEHLLSTEGQELACEVCCLISGRLDKLEFRTDRIVSVEPSEE